MRVYGVYGIKCVGRRVDGVHSAPCTVIIVTAAVVVDAIKCINIIDIGRIVNRVNCIILISDSMLMMVLVMLLLVLVLVMSMMMLLLLLLLVMMMVVVVMLLLYECCGGGVVIECCGVVVVEYLMLRQRDGLRDDECCLVRQHEAGGAGRFLPVVYGSLRHNVRHRIAVHTW